MCANRHPHGREGEATKLAQKAGSALQAATSTHAARAEPPESVVPKEGPKGFLSQSRLGTWEKPCRQRTRSPGHWAERSRRHADSAVKTDMGQAQVSSPDGQEAQAPQEGPGLTPPVTHGQVHWPLAAGATGQQFRNQTLPCLPDGSRRRNPRAPATAVSAPNTEQRHSCQTRALPRDFYSEKSISVVIRGKKPTQ